MIGDVGGSFTPFTQPHNSRGPIQSAPCLYRKETPATWRNVQGNDQYIGGTDMDSVSQKHCYKCGKWKDRSDFYKDKYERDGLTQKCKNCCKAATKKWEQENPQKAIDKANRNPKHIQRVVDWQRRNRERTRIHKLNRRARELGAEGRVTLAEWRAILDRYGRRCLYPGCDRTDIQRDHVLPLVKGGTNTADNLQPLCSHHNASKGAKYIDYRYDHGLNS